MTRARRSRPVLSSDPLWYKDAIIYELRVGAFQDSDDDGIGDFRGLTQRLDYLQDLGVTALWLLPFYPSPRRDDGYDIADYCAIHPDAGTIDDFIRFLDGAHARGLRVITELVMNHTSDQHPWFQRARRAAPGSQEREFYVWTETPAIYREARIIFKDFERSNWAWDPVANAYFWHRFYSHQPDLNFDSPEVRSAMLKVLDFWLRLGVDGLRLDAVPYLFERDGTNCENLPETHQFLRALRAHVDHRYERRMLLAEANQWPEDAVSYFGDGDECHMAFHFPVMPRLFMALHMEDRYPIIDILEQTPPTPPTCQWAMFLRNHDELTLEMVTDEERDYMYRVYAHDTQARINLGIRRRLAPLLGKDRRRIELMNALLLSLPGAPVIYYGDEIGMGDNFYLGDRNGVRTPMQWSGDRNAGFSRANPQRLYLPIIVDPEYHYETTNVEAQQANPHSLLWWMKRLIGLRKRYRAFSRGSIRFLTPSNRKVLAFVREHEQEQILMVANLSRFAQHVELDLSAHRGRVVIEVFGRTQFPNIGEGFYPLTLGPHSFYWFALEKPQTAGVEIDGDPLDPPRLVLGRGGWRQLLAEPGQRQVLAALRRLLSAPGWLGARAARMQACSVQDVVDLSNGGGRLALAIVRVDLEGERQLLLIPLQIVKEPPHGNEQQVVARIAVEGGGVVDDEVLIDASASAALGEALLEMAGRRRVVQAGAGEVVPVETAMFRDLWKPDESGWRVVSMAAEGVPSYFVAGERVRMKLYRHLVEGLNPAVEIGFALAQQSRPVPVPPLVAALQYRSLKQEPMTLGVIHEYVRHEGDLWRFTVDHLKQYFDHALTAKRTLLAREIPPARVVSLIDQDPPSLILEMIGAYLETARLLGQRVAQLHQALAAITDDPDVAPEPFNTLYQRSLYQSLRNVMATVSFALRDQLATLPPEARAAAERLLVVESDLRALCHRIVNVQIGGARIRCHGDLHLGRVLHTGRDLMIVGFEGDPSRPLSERRLKRSPLRDIAATLRSFAFAADRILHGPAGTGVIRPEDIAALEPWARFWERWVGSAFLRAYVHDMAGSGLIPEAPDQLDRLLTVLLIERGLTALAAELKERPSHVGIPIRGLLELTGVA